MHFNGDHCQMLKKKKTDNVTKPADDGERKGRSGRWRRRMMARGKEEVQDGAGGSQMRGRWLAARAQLSFRVRAGVEWQPVQDLNGGPRACCLNEKDFLEEEEALTYEQTSAVVNHLSNPPFISFPLPLRISSALHLTFRMNSSSSSNPSYSSLSTLFFLLRSAKAMHESVLSPPPFLYSSPVINSENRINHSLLLFIVILAIVFFVSGIFHLLVRCFLMRPIAREPEEHTDGVTALQGQLRQLFHLHDAGVDQSFIDMLPVFLYKAIVGIKDPFDCAVCLCEFGPEDKLRLLPKCSHAFHLECIDTWLLSHSTCPLCRSSLLNGCCSPRSPMVLVLDSASEAASGRRESVLVDGGGDDDDDDDDEPSAFGEAAAKEPVAVTVAVKLGKFKSTEAEGQEATSSNANASNSSQRRCFSMGSYEYVMEDYTMLWVPIEPPKKPYVKKSGHRIAMSECDCHSRREGFRGLDRAIAPQDGNVSAISSGGLHLKESFSASKIWLQAKEKSDTSRRAISFRLPLNWAMTNRLKLKDNASPAATAASVFNVSPWGKNSSEVDLDIEVGSSSYSVGSRVDEARSFTRTLFWLVGRQNRAGNHL
ncbi:RING-H2 finger protein ATL13-like [Zingiber officinale]|uniref:RING-H2 finger protein ATL13-like n=1 Tax=Zingiber officinale TaxID=94328 RepID=UPI001C4DA7A0|nr:RING-H2 finger protein ATL13-like [Zingiber officinale]